MNTKLYVLGAVLGAAPGLSPRGNHAVVVPPPDMPEAKEEPRDAGSDGRTRGAGEADVPRHPCELITIMKVPCDTSRETCEYTYWKCPEVVSPLRA
ncbi:hypothetical protein ACLESO_26655 [Pyxidicoccus sp. 3LG]